MLLCFYSQLESLTAKQSSDSTYTKSAQPSPLYSISTSSPIPSTHRSTASTTLLSSTILSTLYNTDSPQSSTHFTVKSTETSTASYTKLSAKTEKTFIGVTVNPSLKKPTQTSTVHHSRGSQPSVDKQKTEALSSGTSRWVQHLKGYVILRDLERFLSRLARDYTILQAKH